MISCRVVNFQLACMQLHRHTGQNSVTVLVPKFGNKGVTNAQLMTGAIAQTRLVLPVSLQSMPVVGAGRQRTDRAKTLGRLFASCLLVFDRSNGDRAQVYVCPAYKSAHWPGICKFVWGTSGGIQLTWGHCDCLRHSFWAHNHYVLVESWQNLKHHYAWWINITCILHKDSVRFVVISFIPMSRACTYMYRQWWNAKITWCHGSTTWRCYHRWSDKQLCITG